MKTMKLVFPLGLIVVGSLIGTYLSIVSSGAIFGGAIFGAILGGMLYCIINWFRSRRESKYWPDLDRLYEQHHAHMNQQEGDNVARRVQETIIEEQMRHSDDIPF